MAVSVLSAAGVVTTQKAAANGLPQPIVIGYNPGAKYSYTPKQFNYPKAYFSTGSPDKNIKHFEAATGGAAYSSMSTLRTQSGVSYAKVGTYWQLNLGGADWTTVANMPCKVTVKVAYHIEAKGTDAGTTAGAWWGPDIDGSYYSSDVVHGNDPVHAKSVVTTTTWQGKVGDLFYSTTDGQYGIVGAGVYTSTYTPGAGQASAALVCSSIVLEFPAS